MPRTLIQKIVIRKIPAEMAKPGYAGKWMMTYYFPYSGIMEGTYDTWDEAIAAIAPLIEQWEHA